MKYNLINKTPEIIVANKKPIKRQGRADEL